MNSSEINKLEMRLLAVRQAKQVAVSLVLGVLTLVFLDSVHTLSAVLHSLHGGEIFAFFLMFTAYSVAGAFGLGTLARYAFIRHTKRVQADIERVRVKRLALPPPLRARVFTLNHAPVDRRGTSFEPSRQLLRA